MSERRKSIYLNAEMALAWEQAKDKLTNTTFQRLIERFIININKGEFEEIAHETRMDVYQQRIDQLADQEATLRVQLESTNQERQQLIARRDELAEEYERTKYITILPKLMVDLNRIIIATDYNEQLILETARPLVERISELNPQFKLSTWIARFRELYSS